MMIGDLLIYESFVTLGPRRTVQALTFAPAVTVLLGWVFLGEILKARAVLGIVLVIAGTCWAVLRGGVPRENSREPGVVSSRGLVCAFGGAICMAIGAVLVRRSFEGPPVDGIIATSIRVGSAAILLWIIPLVRGSLGKTLSHLRNPFVLGRISAGSVFGPGIGMICYVTALKFAEAGLVSTLVATSPLFALPISVVRYRAHITIDIIVAAIVAVVGVGLISL
jgi:drug/metabolite transporter (DMT)-like permease